MFTVLGGVYILGTARHPEDGKYPPMPSEEEYLCEKGEEGVDHVKENGRKSKGK